MPQDNWEEFDFSHIITSTVFDCCALPFEFVLDTGRAALEEIKALGKQIQLPFPQIYFEFDDKDVIYGLFATEYHNIEVKIGTFPEMSVEEARALARKLQNAPPPAIDPNQPYSIGLTMFERFAEDDIIIDGAIAEFGNGKIDEDGDMVPFFEIKQETDNPAHDAGLELIAAPLLLGVLTLLADKLVIDTLGEPAIPRLSTLWGRGPRRPSPSHVLTVNVPAVRYAASRAITLKGTHESPCLHWRRGHSRTLHRGSEFESSTWVRRCLVGDPDKGFVKGTYKLVHRLPMPGPPS
jgi:hypothetical protein